MQMHNLFVLTYTNSFTFWYYRADTMEIHPQAFADAADIFRLGDHIIWSAPNGSAILVYTQHGLICMAKATWE